MKAVLISINPKYCELIARGKKTLEVRKTRPKIETPFKCFIYCTKPKYEHEDYISFNEGTEQARAFYGGGKIIGEFVCDRIEEFESEFFDDDTVMNGIYRVVEDEDYPGERIITQIASNEEDSENFWICTLSCLSFDQIKKYIGWDKREKTFYGWHISNLVIYDKPKELWEFYKPGFEAIEDLEGDELCRYCHRTDYGSKAFGITPNGYYSCEGAFCGESYELYLEDNFAVQRPPQSWCYVEEVE